jgi:Tfp pilus assembly protein PilO
MTSVTARRVLVEKRHLIWPLAIALLVNAALLALVVYPLSRKVAGGEEQAEAAAASLDEARRDYASARATVTGKQTADEALEQFYGAVLPPDLSGARRISYLRIEQLLGQASLRLDQRTNRATPVQDSRLGKLTMSVTFSGTYQNVRRFVYALETSPEFLVLENVALSQNERAEGTLNVTVLVATYFRTGGDGD